jgi:threonine dehydrogenase-like Zn-dependent dehydrogenase
MTDYQLLLTAPRSVSKVALELAQPRGTEVLVRIHTVGICATDLALYDGTYSAPHAVPLCFGHEWSGVVEEVGEAAQTLHPGDKVVGECSLWCGHCDRCARNRNLCRSIQKFGITTSGAARTHALVEERYLHRAEPGVEFAVLALAEPLSVAAKAVAAAVPNDGNLTSERALVLGGGMIGIACSAVLRLLYECPDVTLFDPLPERQLRATWFEAKHPTATDIVPAQDSVAYDQLYGADGYDLVFETTGSPAALRQALAQLNPGGTLVHLGFLDQATFSPKLLTLKGARMIGSIGGTGVFQTVVPWLSKHADALRPLITETFPAEDYENAFTAAADKQKSLKTQLAF